VTVTAVFDTGIVKCYIDRNVKIIVHYQINTKPNAHCVCVCVCVCVEQLAIIAIVATVATVAIVLHDIFETSKLENSMSRSTQRASVVGTRPVLGTLSLFRNYCRLNFVISFVIRVIINYIIQRKV